ncbi:MAG: response regulator [Elusimicrobiales bacterium]
MGKNILVVEDDKQMQRLYARVLGGEGYRLTLADCAVDGCCLLENGSYDLVITDFRLGDGTGEEVMEAARGTKTMLVTGAMEKPELEALSLRYGLTAFFKKPFRLEELLSKIREALG